MDKKFLKNWMIDIPTIKIMTDNYAVDVYKKNHIRTLAVYKKNNLKNSRYGELKYLHFIEKEKWTTYLDGKWYPGSLDKLKFGVYGLETKITKNRKIVKYINKKEEDILNKKETINILKK